MVEFFIFGYIIGSIPFGLILTKIFLKQDIRKTGSGNIGATNVLRSGNKVLAFFTLFLDVIKGAFIPLMWAFVLLDLSKYGAVELPQTAKIYVENSLLIYGLGAVIGHCFPVWLKFKGGKGVATALGALLAAVPYVGMAACVAWLVTAKLTKISSLSALVAIGIAPVVTFVIYGSDPAGICALITLLVWIRHKDNIKRLLKGEEPKIGSKKKKEENPNIAPVPEQE